MAHLERLAERENCGVERLLEGGQEAAVVSVHLREDDLCGHVGHRDGLRTRSQECVAQAAQRVRHACRQEQTLLHLVAGASAQSGRLFLNVNRKMKKIRIGIEELQAFRVINTERLRTFD